MKMEMKHLLKNYKEEIMKEIIYSSNNKFENFLKNNNFIPYRVSPRIQYENRKYYYSDYWGNIFQVLNVTYENNLLSNAYIKWEDGNYGLICTDLDFRDYKLVKDKKNICNKDIINDNEYYTGAEIIFWFFKHNINCFNQKYKGFWKYIDSSSAHRLADNTKYKLSAILKNDIYTNCMIIKKSK